MGSTFERVHPGTDGHAIPLDAKHSGSDAMDQDLAQVPPAKEDGTNLIWLPNTLVTGTNSGETSPIRRLRSRNDFWSPRLLIDLYQAQNLSADSGISRRVLRHPYTKHKIAESRSHAVWGFSEEEKPIAAFAPSTEAFWHASANDGTENQIWSGSLVEISTNGLRIFAVPHHNLLKVVSLRFWLQPFDQGVCKPYLSASCFVVPNGNGRSLYFSTDTCKLFFISRLGRTWVHRS